MKDLKTIRITFSGLCMFVQREKPEPGLYVLLPNMTGHHESEHCAVLEVATPYRKRGAWRTNLSKAKPVDWSGIAPATSTIHALPWVVDTKKLTGKNVDDQWLTMPNPTGKLAWRLRLPLGTLPTPVGERARLKGGGHVMYVAGRSRVDIEVMTPPSEEPIEGLVLQSVDHELHLLIRNEPPDEILGVGSSPWGGTNTKHLTGGYYPLVVGAPTHPPLVIDEPRGPHQPSHKTCDEVFAEPEPLLDAVMPLMRGAMGVDPARCGNGGGG